MYNLYIHNCILSLIFMLHFIYIIIYNGTLVESIIFSYIFLYFIYHIYLFMIYIIFIYVYISHIQYLECSKIIVLSELVYFRILIHNSFFCQNNDCFQRKLLNLKYTETIQIVTSGKRKKCTIE